MKPGYKGSEFWVSLLSMTAGVVGLIVSTFFPATGWGSIVLTLISGLALIVPVPGYQAARGRLKVAEVASQKELASLESKIRELSLETDIVPAAHKKKVAK